MANFTRLWVWLVDAVKSNPDALLVWHVLYQMQDDYKIIDEVRATHADIVGASGLSKKRVRAALRLLEATGCVAQPKRSKYLLADSESAKTANLKDAESANLKVPDPATSGDPSIAFPEEKKSQPPPQEVTRLVAFIERELGTRIWKDQTVPTRRGISKNLLRRGATDVQIRDVIRKLRANPRGNIGFHDVLVQYDTMFGEKKTRPRRQMEDGGLL